MRRLTFITTLFAVLTCGCAAPLQTATNVANALGVVASTSGEAVNTAFARAEHACLWRSDGSEVTTTLAEQKSCVSGVRAKYAEPLAAYDDFHAAWLALSAAIHAAEAAEILGRAPDLAKLEALIAALTEAADRAMQLRSQVTAGASQ